MLRRPPRSTRTYPLLPSPTLFRSLPCRQQRLRPRLPAPPGPLQRDAGPDPGHPAQPLVLPVADGRHAPGDRSRPLRRLPRVLPRRAGFHESVGRGYAPDAPDAWKSEEHTSELQSLMRISYAVFCLKNKINKDLSNYDHLYLYILINL